MTRISLISFQVIRDIPLLLIGLNVLILFQRKAISSISQIYFEIYVKVDAELIYMNVTKGVNNTYAIMAIRNPFLFNWFNYINAWDCTDYPIRTWYIPILCPSCRALQDIWLVSRKLGNRGWYNTPLNKWRCREKKTRIYGLFHFLCYWYRH